MKDTPHADLPENWRDARLAQALRHMPDADLQPGARTRHAVLQRAQNVMAATSTKGGAINALRRWLRDRWGQTASGARLSLVLASLAVFGCMVLLWQAQMAEMGAVDDVGRGRDPGRSAATHEAVETTVVADASPPHAPAPESARASAAPPAAASVLAQSKARARAVVPAAPPAVAVAPSQQASPAAVANPVVEAVAVEMEMEVASADAATGANAVAPAARAMAEAKLQQRARVADGAVPQIVRILAGKRQGRLSLEQSSELLAQLRALRYGTAPGLAAGVGMAQEGMVVEMEGQERWVIAPDYVEHHSRVVKDADAGMGRSAITPEQYAQFVRLVNALLPR